MCRLICCIFRLRWCFVWSKSVWADADSDDDQGMLRDYMRSGQAWEMVMSSGGANFPENDKKSSGSSSDEGN